MKIVIGVTSSIAAYKACELVRLFVKDSHDVHVVMSEKATHLVGPLTFEVLSGNRVYTDMFSQSRREMGHIRLKENSSLFLVAPATANCIGKMANGIADDLISTTFLSMECPTAVAPAMNPAMWNNEAVQKNITVLRERNITIIGPVEGDVACGDTGTGKLADVRTIYTKASELI